MVVHGHVVRVGVVIAVCDTRQYAVLLAVEFGESAAQALGGSSQNAVVMLILLAELVGTVAHIGDDTQTQLLCLVALAMMLSYQGNQTLGQSDESDTQCSVIDNGSYGIVGAQLLAVYPKSLHQQGELLGEGRLLELHTLVQLLCRNLQQTVQFGKEGIDTVLLILDAHTFNGQTNDVDGREAEVTTTDTCLGSKAVLEHTGTATHGGALPLVTLRIILAPVLVLVVGGIQVDEVGEEPASRYLAGKFVEVVVLVGRQVAQSLLLLPNLNGEDGRLAVSYTLVCAAQNLADDATTLRAGVRTIVDTAEDHLVSATRMDGVHVMDKGLHSLMNPAYSLVDGMLLDALSALESCQGSLQEVVYGSIVQLAVVLGIQLLQHLHLLDIRTADEGSQIIVEGRNGLTAVHLVLYGLHADTAQDAGCLDTLGRAALAMTSLEAMLQNLVQRMLNAGERLGGIVVLVVNMQVVILHGLAGAL